MNFILKLLAIVILMPLALYALMVLALVLAVAVDQAIPM